MEGEGAAGWDSGGENLHARARKIRREPSNRKCFRFIAFF
jgi:hypothetical protein